jgi:3-oxoacyl-[acyl-carrier-protein] synthase-1
VSRVVVTGMGIVSCLGNELPPIARALRESRSGIRYVEAYERAGMRSRVAGLPDLASEPPIERKLRRFMGNVAVYAHHAMRKAVADAKLTAREVSDPRVGLIVGSGTGSMSRYLDSIDTLRTKGTQKMPPYTVPQTMGSSAAACLSTAYGIRGRSYCISSACASSAHSIGHAMELIRMGKQDRVFAGGAEEADWTSAVAFDAMGALSAGRNDAPGTASRPYDAGRDGFVMGAGAGILVLESLERARARGARIYAELAGYGASSDGKDMIAPEPEGVARAMRLALEDAGVKRVDYLNTHATSTQIGDLVELAAVREVYENELPLISSTKGLTGHAIGASGAQEAIYAIIMMQEGFVAPCANLDIPDPATSGFPLLSRREDRAIDSFMSNSLGFGGANASLVFRR